MPKYTVRQTYTKTDVWFDVEANSKDEAIEKIHAPETYIPCDDEEFGFDTFTEVEESEEHE